MKYESIKAQKQAKCLCLRYLDIKGKPIREEFFSLNGKYTGEYFNYKYSPDGTYTVTSSSGYENYYNADGVQVGMYDPYEDAVF